MQSMQSAPLFLYIEDNFLRIFRIDEQIVTAVPSALFEIFRVFPQQMLLHLLLLDAVVQPLLDVVGVGEDLPKCSRMYRSLITRQR